MKILYVDDDPDDLELFSRVVKELNSTITCITVQNGEDALAMLANLTELPSYIFLDINMPRMDGIACLSRIKDNPKTKAIPVIMFSTSLHGAHAKVLEHLGAPFLAKGVLLKQLRDDLSKYILPER